MTLKHPIFDIEEQASKAGLNVAQLCRRAEIARSTYDRILKKALEGKPAGTFLVIDKLRNALTASGEASDA